MAQVTRGGQGAPGGVVVTTAGAALAVAADPPTTRGVTATRARAGSGSSRGVTRSGSTPSSAGRERAWAGVTPAVQGSGQTAPARRW